MLLQPNTAEKNIASPPPTPANTKGSLHIYICAAVRRHSSPTLGLSEKSVAWPGISFPSMMSLKTTMGACTSTHTTTSPGIFSFLMGCCQKKLSEKPRLTFPTGTRPPRELCRWKPFRKPKLHAHPERTRSPLSGVNRGT